MMLWNILAQDGDAGQLVWIIAVLILSAIGYLAEWLRNKQSEKEAEQRKRRMNVPSPTPEQREKPPVRPTHRRQEQPTSRPVARPRPRSAERTTSPQPRPPTRPTQPPPTTEPARPAIPIPVPQEGIAPPRAPRARRRQAEQPAVQAMAEAQQKQAAEMANLRERLRQAETQLQRQHKMTPAEVADALKNRSFKSITSEELRRAVILREIFALPPALREEPGFGGWSA